MEYSGGIEFTENPTFKNMLKKTAESEMKEGLVKNIKMYKERVEAFKSSGGKEEEKIQASEPA